MTEEKNEDVIEDEKVEATPEEVETPEVEEEATDEKEEEKE